MENQALRAENQSLKDEIAAEEPAARPPIKPAKPSGMEKATQPTSGNARRRLRVLRIHIKNHEMLI
jgi:hypothetical protein